MRTIFLYDPYIINFLFPRNILSRFNWSFQTEIDITRSLKNGIREAALNSEDHISMPLRSLPRLGVSGGYLGVIFAGFNTWNTL